MEAPLCPAIPPPIVLGGWRTADRSFLEHAIRLGRRGWGHARPNPMVGCVLVRDGVTVGEGWHREFGGPHAEIEALEMAGEAARGATAYVSLEPCAHEGKTPPCAPALHRAGIERVVFAAPDRGARSGGGAAILGALGVEVVGPTHPAAFAATENPEFSFDASAPRPYTVLKLAMTLDGMISAGPGIRTAITDPGTTPWIHRLRAGFDGILVGAGTARVDDPLLTVREAPAPRVPPIRVVADPSARLPTDARMLTDSGPPTHVYHGPDAPEPNRKGLREAGAVLHALAGGPGRIDLHALMGSLRDQGVRAVLCEGGSRLATSLLDQDLVDRMILLIAPTALGSGGVPAALPAGLGAERSRWRFVPMERGPEADALVVFDRAVD